MARRTRAWSRSALIATFSPPCTSDALTPNVSCFFHNLKVLGKFTKLAISYTRHRNPSCQEGCTKRGVEQLPYL
jgi:hypothetical protein